MARFCQCGGCAYERSCPPDRMEKYSRKCWVAQDAGTGMPECHFFIERNWVTQADWRRARRRLKGLRVG